MTRRFRRILHPSDFSSASGLAFKKAVELANANRAALLLLHVRALVAPIVGEGYVSAQTFEDLERSSRAWAQKQLDRLLARARQAGVRARGVLAEGVAHTQIVRVAKSRRADLIVMGTHGRSGVAKLFLGSVATRVVAGASCPVLTVRGR